MTPSDFLPPPAAAAHRSEETDALSRLDLEVLHAAAAALPRAHAPYSRFFVGAALRGRDGDLFAGCNVENASYPEGWCAETSALAALVLAGQQPFSTAAVVVRATTPCSPCGGCRQRLAELAAPGARVLMANLKADAAPAISVQSSADGSQDHPFAEIRVLTLDQLLPERFSGEILPA
ncbi:MAG: cytidine deaminase [Acidobacteriota bacterium]